MALIQVNNLIKYYGADAVLRGASLEIQAGEKWGLVGRNGCGKSTLMRILAGLEDYDQGEIHIAQNCQIDYLRQEAEFTGELTVYQELRALFGKVDSLQAKLAQLQEEMSQPGLDHQTLEQLVEEHHRLNEEFENAGGYRIEGRIQGVLRGLGFPKERWEDRPTVLSGGEQTRLALAKILLTSSDLLLLDEPTNYLDLAAIEWLEGFLGEYRGAVLLISHDRFFLNRIVKGIYELEFGKINRYRGNYTSFKEQKAAKLEAQGKVYHQQEKYIERQEKLIRESRTDEKSKRKAHSLERRLEKLERIERPQEDDKSIKINFRSHQPSSRLVLEVEQLSKSFATKQLFNKINFRLEAGEKVGLIGPNGAGKTTLLKIILGSLSPDEGRIRLGYEVYPGYFSQVSDESDLSGTPFSVVMDAADLDNTEARTILGRFLFSGDDVFKSVADLSGGERRRLGLIKLMLSKANFLILDEPTNHLDLDSIEALEQAVTDFDGTVLIVSHDRYFLNQVVDRYLALNESSLRSFQTYQDYLDWRDQAGSANQEMVEKPKSDAELRRQQNKEVQREQKRKQRLLEQLEAEISSLEKNKAELTGVLSQPEFHADYIKSKELSDQLSECEGKLAELYLKWEQLQLELVEINYNIS